MAHGWKYYFLQTCKDFGNNTALYGWKYIVDKKRDRFEKLLWWCIQITAIVSAVYIFYIISKNFWITPIITTLESSNYPISKVPFPAVAVCDVNRISRRMALEFAKERYQTYNVSLERMFRVTRALGKLYDYNDEDMDLLFEFNRMLESNKNNIQFDYRRFINTMIKLTPSCSDNILKCVWKSKTVNCSEIFNFRRTMFGFCCTFNYYKSLDHVFLAVANVSSHKDTEYLSMSGYETGLSLVLRSEPDDYYYPLNNIEGLNVLIYNSRDYPDTSSGGLVESLIPLQREIFLQIESVTVEAVQILQEYPRDVRGCVFSTEDKTSFDSSYYSYSDCLNDCKMKSILALCECVPFYMSITKNLPFSTQLCTLSDIVCLNKYKEKWNTMAPNKRGPELDYEIQNSIDCPHCLPSCSYINYFIFNEQATLVDLNSTLLNGLNVSQISLVHIYFDKETSMLYCTDLYYYWFDIISNFGGMCGVFLGLSLLSVIEILYFFTFHFLVLLNSRTNQKYIHGLAKIFRCESWCTALFWLVISIGGMVSFHYLLRSNTEVFDNQPVLRHIDTTAYPISLVPFPAVTVCSFNFVYKPKSDKIKAILIRNGVDEVIANEFFGNMALLKIPALVNNSHYSKLYQILAANGYSDNEKLMEDLAHPCDKILEFCSWAGEQVDCLSIFTQSKAEMGICCSFNSDLYPIKKDFLRQYYSSAGPTLGLGVIFNMSTINYVSSVFQANTVIVYVHDKAAYAEDSAFFAMIGPGREITMKISAEIFQADPELEQIRTEARKCLLDGEGSRVLNQHYSMANCMHLCRRNAIGNLCGCVPHFYPDFGIWDSCTLMDLYCLKNHMENFTALQMSSDVHNHNSMTDISCDCLPSCSGMKYGGSLETLFYQNSVESTQQHKKGAVRVYFRKNWCNKFTIIRATTADTFIALVGGMFALCLGGSLLSFVEFFYFALKSLLTKYKRQTRYEHEGINPDLYWTELQIYKIHKSPSKIKRPVQWNTIFDNFIN